LQQRRIAWRSFGLGREAAIAPIIVSARERKKDDMNDMIPVLEGGSRQEARVTVEKTWWREQLKRSRSCDDET
jgi:hypothetical protein